MWKGRVLPLAQRSCRRYHQPPPLQCNVRDFDYYGAAYTILSAIATGGVNAVVCDIAARDEARNKGAGLPNSDVQFKCLPRAVCRASSMHSPQLLRIPLSLSHSTAVGLTLRVTTASCCYKPSSFPRSV